MQLRLFSPNEELEDISGPVKRMGLDETKQLGETNM
jgi:hypothetical protein